MDEVRYREIIKMVKSGCECRVRVKDFDDIAATCIYDDEYEQCKDAETEMLFNQDMIDMCGKVFDVTREDNVSSTHISIRHNGFTWCFLPQWIDEVNQFDDDVIETCDEILI